ncbi:MAG TPA: integrin alpha, partial [Myxococcota bacterium]|nr:integrin alpha [Myxococcota bacterium]
LVQYGGSWSGAYTPSSVDLLLTGVGGLGAAVAAPGDIDGDGFGELLLGSPDSSAGKAYLLSSAGLVSGAVESSGAASWNGEVSGDLFGLSLGGVADLDRDGTTDIVVAAPGYDYNSVSSSGKAYVLSTP